MYVYTAGMPLIGSDPSGLQLFVPRVAPNVTPRPNVFPRIYVPEPRPFIPTPPLPPPIPMPHGGPGSGPTSPPDPDPITDPDAVDLPPPGKCTQIRYDQLQDAVHSACKGKDVPQACGFWGWSCDDFSEHEKRWNNCAKARRQIMNECFGGGNKIHRKVAKEAEEQAKKCADKFYFWCFDPPKCDWQPLYAMN